MRRRIFTFVFIAGLFTLANTEAQIPVIDKLQITNNIERQAETIAKWKLQYDQMVLQIAQMQQQYQSLTGSRNLGEIMNNPSLREYLPADWQAVYDSVRKGGYASLSGTGQAIYGANQVFDGCAFLPAGEQRMTCEAQAVKGAQDKGLALDAYNAAKQRLSQIDGLMQRINTTQDPKAIAELQGRIAIEQANIQNEYIKLQMYAMAAQAEDRLLQQRAHEIDMRDAAKRGTLSIKPMTAKELKLGR